MVWGDETRILTQDISTSHELRREALKQMQEDTRNFLTQTGSELKEMSARLKEDLTKVKSELAQAEVERVRQMGGELREMVTQIHAILEKVRPDLSQAESERARQTEAELKEMSTRLKADLTKVKLTLTKEETDRVKQAQIVIKERVTAVNVLLGEVKAEREIAAAAWLELVNVMRAETGMAAPPVAEPAKEEAVAKGESVEGTPETIALSDQVLAYLADHLDGTRMTELEGKFGVARIQMAKLLKELMDENKAEKRDMLYFAI